MIMFARIFFGCHWTHPQQQLKCVSVYVCVNRRERCFVWLANGTGKRERKISPLIVEHVALSLSPLLCQMCPVSHSKCRKAGSPIYIVSLFICRSRMHCGDVSEWVSAYVRAPKCEYLCEDWRIRRRRRIKRHTNFSPESTILKFHVADSIKFIHSIWGKYAYRIIRMCIFVCRKRKRTMLFAKWMKIQYFYFLPTTKHREKIIFFVSFACEKEFKRNILQSEYTVWSDRDREKREPTRIWEISNRQNCEKICFEGNDRIEFEIENNRLNWNWVYN